MNRHWHLTRKNLSLAATGLALVSWYTTAHGLLEFVFHNWWQAAIISGAIQITLFILNLKLISYIKNNRWGVLPLWIACLTASCTFSYVYISSAIYNDSLYYSDADRVIEEKITEMSLQVNEYISNNITYNKNIMEQYCSTLADLNIAYISSSDASAILDGYINLLKSNDLHKMKDPTMMQSIQLLENVIQVFPADYSDQDIQSAINNISSIKKYFNDYLSVTDKLREDEFQMWQKINKRLEQYPHFQDPEFIELQQQNTERGEYINSLDSKIVYIKTAINTTNNSIEGLKREQQNNSGNKITSAKQNLLLEMNKDSPDLDRIEFYANQIYEAIISQNISNESFEIKDYYKFKNAVSQYRTFQGLKSEIENSIESLDNPRIGFTLNETNIHDESELHTWKNNWYEILHNLKNIIRSCPLPNELTTIPDDADVTESIQLIVYPFDEFSSETMITTISEIERSYLADLNIIEKTLNLLVTKYKYMAWFSLFSAILLDLIGTLIGIFLYYNNSNVRKAQNTQPNLDKPENIVSGGIPDPSVS